MMNRKDFVINGNILKEKSEKMIIDAGQYTQKITEDKSSYSSKFHELSKNTSFTSTSTELDEDDKPFKAQSFCGLLCLILALAACVSGCYIMWATDLFMLIVHQNLALSNNSMRYEAWKTPPVHAMLRVYVFNYTNVEEFESRVEPKLKVQELGPYTYKETLERIDVRFNKNGTATYRNKKTYKFLPEDSVGNESDVIVIPNLPFLAATSFYSNLSPFLKWSFRQILHTMGGQPFIPLTINQFLWGYEDRLSVLAQKLITLQYGIPFQKFGILSSKNGTQSDLVTIYTGEEDPSKTGIVVSYDGKTSMDIWHTKECNRIDGTDGTVYPPALVHPNSTLYIYSKDFCRKMPLRYNESYNDKHGIAVLNFRIPKNVFESGHVMKDNACFCNKISNNIQCLPSGIFNVGPCTFKAPIVTSLPHFLYGDPILFKGIEGLQPEVKKHESFVEVDAKMGIPVGGKSRLQLNIMVSGEFGSYSKNRMYKNQYVFPFAWMDYGIDRLPDDISAMIRSLLSFIKVAEFALSYGFIISAIILGVVMISNCRQVYRKRHYIDNVTKSSSDTPLVVVNEKS